MPAKPLALRYRRRLWQTLRTVEAVAAGKVKGARWDQATYASHSDSCGTACCFAGWAAMNTGKTITNSAFFRDAAHRIVHIGEWAQGYLGLDYGERCRLFNGRNSLRTLKRLVREFAGPEPKAGRR